MAFFEPDAPLPDPEPERRDPRNEPPSDELPAIVPESIVIASTEHVVVALTHVRVFSDGVEFALERRYRRGSMSRGDFQRFVHDDRYATDPDDRLARLRYGLLLADGQALASGRWHAPEDPEPTGHTLLRGGGAGGGGDSAYAMTEHLWLHPLPPPGPIELVVQWPAVGIPETHVTVEAMPSWGGSPTCVASGGPDPFGRHLVGSISCAARRRPPHPRRSRPSRRRSRRARMRASRRR